MYICEYPIHDLYFNNTFSDKFARRFSCVLKLKSIEVSLFCLTNERVTGVPLKYSSNAFTYENHALTTFQFVTDMRWFRGHAEAPRLLRLSPLRADEDVNETSYHFRARSRCRGKSRLKWRRDHLSRCRKSEVCTAIRATES